MLHSTFLAQREKDAPSVLALLSVSSKPSQIPGYGVQGMPVLSFHTPNLDTQQMDPVPWGSRRTPPPASQAAPETQPARRHGREKRPAAVGQAMDAADFDRREKEWLQDPVVNAHVPLPSDDARTAHLLSAVPASAGGGVLVFCANSIIYVPPPSLESVHELRKAKRHSKEKRRMSSGKEVTIEARNLARNTSKRRKIPEEPSMKHGKSLEIDQDLEDSRNLATEDNAFKLVHLRLNKSVTIASATVIEKENEASPELVAQLVLGATDGALYQLDLLSKLHDESSHDLSATPPLSSSKLTKMRLHRLGTSSPTTGYQSLTNLGERFVHINSAISDSTLVHIGKSLVERYRWPSLGPIVDFVVDQDDFNSDSATSANRRVVTCSGTGPSCSLRVFWNGAGIIDYAQINVPKCLSTHAIPQGSLDKPSELLVLCYATHTRILNLQDQLKDVTSSFLALGAPLQTRAVLVRAWEHESCVWVIVTAKMVAAVFPDSIISWRPNADEEIVVANANRNGELLIGLNNNSVAHLRLANQEWSQLGSMKFAGEIASLALPDDPAINWGLVGLWDPCQVHVVSLAKLESVLVGSSSHIEVPALPVSLLVHKFGHDNYAYLFLALSNGEVKIYQLFSEFASQTTTEIRPVHTLSLGTQPVGLTSIYTHSSILPSGVIAYGKRSYIIYAEGEWLRYKALRLPNIRSICSVSLVPSASQLDSAPVFATLSGETLKFFGLKDLQGTDINTIPLGDYQPTSIAILRSVDSYAVTLWPQSQATSDQAAHGELRIVSQKDFTTSATYSLLGNERPNCVSNVLLDGHAFLVVGTGFFIEEQEEVTAGRILGLEVTRKKSLESEYDATEVQVQLAFSLDVPGNVYGVAPVANKLAAAINSQVITYAMDASNESLQIVSRWGGAFIASCLTPAQDNRTLVIGDAMRSLTVLEVNYSGVIKEVARDVDPYWTTAASTFNEAQQQFVGADIAMNLFVAGRVLSSAANSHEHGHVMRRMATFHYGDMINQLRPMDESHGASQLRARFCTAAGALGILCDVDSELSTLLSLIQRSMAKEMRVPGDIPWEEWRTARTDHRTAPPTDVLDSELLNAYIQCTGVQHERILALASHYARKLQLDLGPIRSSTVIDALNRIALVQ
ncbi:hypothetical protein MYAM1_001942 [Malassezia yamatoensis]|uniref:DNA damage-binding protein 1 n=1 Tax=Malassezia yamatoensis TaxID=253288 RepID=A0AAJ5YR95_9BASI|nr:hypothetical protein MYAM1_001942 [Malassezia yamatoensis]